MFVCFSDPRDIEGHIVQIVVVVVVVLLCVTYDFVLLAVRRRTDQNSVWGKGDAQLR